MTRDIPVIFLTALNAAEDESLGLDLGAADYISKPISPPIVLARIKTQLKLKASADFLRDQNLFLEREVSKRTSVAIFALASLAETRDNDTGEHLRRTQHYVRALARKRQLPEAFIETLYRSAPLHDIGKVGIPDRILLKPGKFEPEEFEIMKTHTTLGYRALEQAERQLGEAVEFLSCAKEIALTHQEKWDGSGYPQGLVGDAIPLSGRLMAVADVYDALICRRVYKEGMPHEKAVAIISAGKGSHFDPELVEAFLSIAEEFREIAARFVDSDQTLADKAKQLGSVIS